jgi:hypothetical protein
VIAAVVAVDMVPLLQCGMRNDECGMKTAGFLTFHFAFIVHHFAFAFQR